MTYLATPYTHTDPAVMEKRFEEACTIAGALMCFGHIIFSPIAHTHPIAMRCDLPRGFDYWEKYDRAMILRCSRLVVAMMDGWQDSKGVTAEIAFAKSLGIQVEYLNVDCIDLLKVQI